MRAGGIDFGWPSIALKTNINANLTNYMIKTTDTEQLITNVPFYSGFGGAKIVRIQRWFGKERLAFLKDFLKPLSEQIGFLICYEIDDVLSYDDIPDYNIARAAFHPDRIGDSVQQIMKLCDLITVSTEELKQFYVKKFGLLEENVVVIPNYLPRWWIGEYLNINKQLAQVKSHKKPVLAFCCSINHFDFKNQNGGNDDFSHLIPWIINNINKYTFLFVGGVPQQLHQLVKENKILYQPPSDLFNYPNDMRKRGIDLLIAPLIDNEFNRCKSNIKFLECAGIGIPMCGQNICTYNKYTRLVFDTGKDIDELCEKLFFSKDSTDYYANIVEQQYKIIAGPSPLSKTGFWLENNLQKYVDLYTTPHKTIHITI